MNDSEKMAVTASKYQTVVTVFTASGSGFDRILTANPARLFVQFMPGPSGVQCPRPIPGPIPPSFGTGLILMDSVEYKWRDSPSICSGEWYMIAGGVWQITIIESLYIGE